MTTKNNRVVLNLSQEDADKLLGHLEISMKQMQGVPDEYATPVNKVIQRIKKSLEVKA